MNKKYSVYKHTNKKNGKVYIGMTSQRPETRWGNGKNYWANKHFSNAINKYGWDGFEHKVLRTNMRKRKASLMESKLIKRYNATNPKFGYNIYKGVANEWKRRKHRGWLKRLWSAIRGKKAL